ncbi:hypothetical protein BKA65DRAFT_38287 [Rhexocercosporidium sp. MPI-PUGE-AT-0058]|nr:hypothetical protein BKA65DRAFT_38287 [Rhexocercosporidium sp. MPI-PUGE-AT-0058]
MDALKDGGVKDEPTFHAVVATLLSEGDDKLDTGIADETGLRSPTRVWHDVPAVSESLVGSYQRTATEAMKSFNLEAETNSIAALAATWGTRRKSDPSLADFEGVSQGMPEAEGPRYPRSRSQDNIAPPRTYIFPNTKRTTPIFKSKFLSTVASVAAVSRTNPVHFGIPSIIKRARNQSESGSSGQVQQKDLADLWRSSGGPPIVSTRICPCRLRDDSDLDHETNCQDCRLIRASGTFLPMKSSNDPGELEYNVKDHVSEEKSHQEVFQGQDNGDDKSDIVSTTSSIPSIADSLLSLMSGSSMSSVIGPEGAAERLIALLLHHPDIRPLCESALSLIDARNLETQLRRLLKDFAVDLRKEVETPKQKHAAHFVRYRARNTAHIICSELKKASGAAVRKGKELERAYPQNASDESGSDTSTEEDDNLHHLEAFIQTSEALKMLGRRLAEFVESLQTDPQVVSMPTTVAFEPGHDIISCPESPAGSPRRVIKPVFESTAGPRTTFMDSSIPYSKIYTGTLQALLRMGQREIPIGRKRLEWKCVGLSIGLSIFLQ